MDYGVMDKPSEKREPPGALNNLEVEGTSWSEPNEALDGQRKLLSIRRGERTLEMELASDATPSMSDSPLDECGLTRTAPTDEINAGHFDEGNDGLSINQLSIVPWFVALQHSVTPCPWVQFLN